MNLNRRSFLALSAAAAMLPHASSASEPDNAVFWRAVFPNYELTLFGYVRIAAHIVPEIFADGKRLVTQTQSTLIDMSPTIKLPAVTFENNQLQPVWDKLAPQTQSEFRAVVANSPLKNSVEKLSGFAASLLLLGEGQHPFSPAQPSIGLALMQYGLNGRRKTDLLAADEEILGLAKPLTLEAVSAVGPATIEYLIALRRNVGPIGTHFEELYRKRQSAEIATLGEEMTSKGVFSPSDLIDSKRARTLFINRLAAQPAGTNAFVALPLGVLSGPLSMLDDLRGRGATITVIG